MAYLALTRDNIAAEHICCAFSDKKHGLVAYCSDRCPYTDFHVRQSLVATATKRGLPLTVVKLETMAQAQAAPTPATVFSLFRDGSFVTTDVSVCLDGRFDRIAG